MFKVPLFFATFLSALSPASQIVETGPLLSTEAILESEYGHGIAIDGDVVAVGAIDRSRFSGGSGTVTIFNRFSTYFGQEQVLHVNQSIGSQFGYSIAIQDDLMVVGAPNYGGKGAAFVYRNNGIQWEKEQALVPSDLVQGDRFGYSVDLDSGVILIGAPYKDDFGHATGAAYAFMYNGSNWYEHGKLLSPSPAIAEKFGFSVAIADNYATIGAPYAHDYGFESGVTHTFRRNGGTWYLYATGYPDDPVDNGLFGYSLSAEYAKVLIGSLGGDAPNQQGAAYLFDLGSGHWDQLHKFTVAPGLADESLGTSVSLWGNQVMISAPEARGQRGAIFSFIKNGGIWTEPSQYISSIDQVDANFGATVRCDQGFMVTGSPDYDSPLIPNKGAAFYYDTLRLDLNPSAPVAGQPIDLHLSGCTPNDWAYLAASTYGLGSTRVPQLDLYLDLQFPDQLETRQLTDAYGSTSWSKIVPPSLAGSTIWLQGFQFRRTTPVVEVMIQ